jgi:hypothetical protein
MNSQAGSPTHFNSLLAAQWAVRHDEDVLILYVVPGNIALPAVLSV